MQASSDPQLDSNPGRFA